jgi:hypothetical protein
MVFPENDCMEADGFSGGGSADSSFSVARSVMQSMSATLTDMLTVEGTAGQRLASWIRAKTAGEACSGSDDTFGQAGSQLGTSVHIDGIRNSSKTAALSLEFLVSSDEYRRKLARDHKALCDCQAQREKCKISAILSKCTTSVLLCFQHVSAQKKY